MSCILDTATGVSTTASQRRNADSVPSLQIYRLGPGHKLEFSNWYAHHGPDIAFDARDH
jgi:hypothetical protein